MNGKEVKDAKYFEKKLEYIAKVRESLKESNVKLANLTKAQKARSFTIFNKSKLRTYLKNPKANEANLRELSQFLYRMSHQYRRLINYYAEMIDLSAFSVIPVLNTKGESDKKVVMKKYYKTLKEVKKIDLKSQIMKALIIAWREDVFYGYTYEDENGFLLMPLNPKYCRISSINTNDGTLNFAFDFSYFRNNADDLEFWGEEFKAKYELYKQNVTEYRWQELDHNRIMCLKVNIEDLDLIIPPFVQLFAMIIDLIDLQSIQSVKDELSIYKLLVARLETISGSDEPDDFAVDPDTAIDYYSRLEEKVPESVATCLSPLPIETIEFKGTTTDDVDMVSTAMSTLFKSAGVAQILDCDHISGTEAFKASILCDSLMATKILLPQIEKWMNRYLTYRIGPHCEVKFMEVTPYTKEDMIAQYAEGAQYGLPVKIAYTTLLGFDPMDVLALTYLENECLELAENWKPLQSSHTQSGNLSDRNRENPEMVDIDDKDIEG